ncbi:MAG: sigma-70 family RNA polymerase sigma factor [Sphingomonas sp.]|uniref:sigma-70 family RNA polymerase sigma factor n=1 Tax=Sphingomonas sp. TaxID=28214 RepID=UPI001AD2946D|nr:sigma-70 family RNA polymerase sigma factor [Sphingomonas sp.]MBN8808008.1 sigma-70 family RNA polymerase sigma factor [Sphingomonas sp.]
MSEEPMPGAFANAQPLTYGRAPARDVDALVRKHAPLVRRIAWHVHGSVSGACEVEDLVQTGLVALVEAIHGFEDRGAVTFEQYLATRLRGAMIDQLRRQATLTRGAMRRRKHYQETVAMLTVGRVPPSDAAIAAHLGVSIEKMRADYASAEAVRFDSLDEVYTDEGAWFMSDDPDAFQQLAESDLRDTLVAAIAGLPEREAQVVQLYYVEELNLEEIGLVLGVGSARVCQIKASAHARLKKALANRI